MMKQERYLDGPEVDMESEPHDVTFIASKRKSGFSKTNLAFPHTLEYAEKMPASTQTL